MARCVYGNNIGNKATINLAKMLIDSNPCRMCGFQLCALIYIHTYFACLGTFIQDVYS